MSASNFRHKILILFSTCLRAKQNPNYINLPMYNYHFKDKNWFSSSDIIKQKIPTYSIRDLFDTQNYFVHSFFRLTFKNPMIDLKVAVL